MENNNQTALAIKDLLKKDGSLQYLTEGAVEVYLTMDILRKLVVVTEKASPPTDTDILMFAYTCAAQGLNPYLKECWLVWLGAQQGWAPVVSAQSRLRKAQSQPDYDGYQWGYIDAEGKRHKAGRESELLNPDQVAGIWGSIKRKNVSVDFYHETWLSEYAKPTKSGYGSWDQRKVTMILKVNRDQTHKFAYAHKMGNLMTENEVPYAHNGPVELGEPKGAALLEEPKPTGDEAGMMHIDEVTPAPKDEHPNLPDFNEDEVNTPPDAADDGALYVCDQCGNRFTEPKTERSGEKYVIACPNCKSKNISALADTEAA